MGTGHNVLGRALPRVDSMEQVTGATRFADDLTLPGTLHDAILRLDRSELARELFGAEFVDGFLASKRMELQSYMDEITPWERRFLGSQV